MREMVWIEKVRLKRLVGSGRRCNNLVGRLGSLLGGGLAAADVGSMTEVET